MTEQELKEYMAYWDDLEAKWMGQVDMAVDPIDESGVEELRPGIQASVEDDWDFT